MRRKRLRHKGGSSAVTRIENKAGEWSIQVDPDNLLIDTFHRGIGVHVRDPADYNRRIPIGETSSEAVYRIVVAHFETNGGLNFESLLQELNRG